MPVGGLHATYHLLREPETAIEFTIDITKSHDLSQGDSRTPKDMGPPSGKLPILFPYL